MYFNSIFYVSNLYSLLEIFNDGKKFKVTAFIKICFSFVAVIN